MAMKAHFDFDKHKHELRRIIQDTRAGRMDEEAAVKQLLNPPFRMAGRLEALRMLRVQRAQQG